jgi:hypothetical protein
MAGGLPPLNDHAVDKHGEDAVKAWAQINGLDNIRKCRYRCKDGRDRYVCPMPGEFYRWAIAVVEGEDLITSFIADPDYARHVIDSSGCNNPFHYRNAHP